MIDETKKKFRELISSGSAQKKRKADQLLPFKSEIKEARLRKFSYEQIADFLKQCGVDVSRHRVREFCLQTLKEKSKRKRKK